MDFQYRCSRTLSAAVLSDQRKKHFDNINFRRVPCHNVVCRNDGTCINDIMRTNDFQCQCTSDWSALYHQFTQDGN